jgi:hypothetical protein
MSHCVNEKNMIDPIPDPDQVLMKEGNPQVSDRILLAIHIFGEGKDDCHHLSDRVLLADSITPRNTTIPDPESSNQVLLIIILVKDVYFRIKVSLTS